MAILNSHSTATRASCLKIKLVLIKSPFGSALLLVCRYFFCTTTLVAQMGMERSQTHKALLKSKQSTLFANFKLQVNHGSFEAFFMLSQKILYQSTIRDGIQHSWMILTFQFESRLSKQFQIWTQVQSYTVHLLCTIWELVICMSELIHFWTSVYTIKIRISHSNLWVLLYSSLPSRSNT